MKGDILKRLETELGGAARDFPSTSWSRLTARDGGDPTAPLRFLAERYWRPIYAYIRARLRCEVEEAKDLTQAFFAWMMDSGFLGKLESGRGTFRGFLKVSLANFLANERERSRALKRGGGVRLISLQAMKEAGAEPARQDESPEEALDRQWREALVDQAVDRVRRDFEVEGRGTWVAIWRDYDLSPAGTTFDHAALAKRYRVSKREVSYSLTKVRERFRRAMIDLVQETVATGADLPQELAEVFPSRE